MYDLVILGGRIYDGSGKDPFVADVGVLDGKIVTIGTIDPASSIDVLDATGAAVSPGFIDCHSHADIAVLDSPECRAKVLQGVTTEIVGNCGLSPAPVGDETEILLQSYIASTLGIPQHGPEWHTFADYISVLESSRPSTNIVACVGHGALRIMAMGFSPRPANPQEMQVMASALEDSLAAGAAGLSLGLLYAPACFADRAELTELCNIVAAAGKLVAVHMENESDRVMDSVARAVALARDTGVRVHISHLKVSGNANWGRMTDVLSLISQAREEGLPITCDQYPYVAGSTMISVLLPQWALEGGVGEMVSRLRTRSVRDRIKEQYEVGSDGWDCLVRANGWDNIVVSWVGNDSCRWLEAKTLSEIASDLDKEPAEALFDVIEEVRGEASIVVFQQSEEDLCQAMRADFVAVGSDGLHVGVRPHPRLFGTFPRVLGRYVRDLNALPLEHAIRKMTALPADILGCTERGQLREGYRADITVFVPELVRDNGTYAEPTQNPDGIKHVVINGRKTVVDGVHTGTRAGVVERVH